MFIAAIKQEAPVITQEHPFCAEGLLSRCINELVALLCLKQMK